ncbi:TPA: hypothetical protein TUD09_001173 [Streptococcus equi subsp. zooepidemicus]|uniref:Uncharacterized protein n=1 Tax=Streptococcus equi subsp. ruminatorum CECT 5772 TaxID=1051981 RepID=A0A922T392_9STRE|nr:hypothetical protein [Streptococcus equi]KED04675.1 hypothetical protein CECT5772_03986 [Streptococcus equi subsp. ruminatorum CECT 5772]HEL0246935.1 hypothetical protein [Streptococcus equi subsp. zooepidemicus]HEL1012188.1 hypothetical protein [Streptococcus equi subsp. ruminatorum]HEL1023935.1 hypothetical protein [Streptococcus equi subsp. ruminatorum CECT 5772]
MTDKTNDILVDYEGLCGELNDILEVLELASAEDGPRTFPILHTANHALKKLITEHCDIASGYRKELNHE